MKWIQLRKLMQYKVSIDMIARVKEDVPWLIQAYIIQYLSLQSMSDLLPCILLHRQIHVDALFHVAVVTLL